PGHQRDREARPCIMTNAFDVSGRTVIVTGAAGLLGQEYARALVGAGASVVLADINRDVITTVATDLRDQPGAAIGVAVDITDEVSVAQLVRTTLSTFGRIDGLVNNAAVNPSFGGDRTSELDLPFEQYSLALWNRALAVNLTGMFLCAREVAPTMLAQQRGVVVNISSTYGLVGPDQRLYEAERPGE